MQDAFDCEKIVKAINAMGLLTYEVRSERINEYLKSLFQMAHFLTRSLLLQSAFDDVLDDVAAFISNYIDELKAADEYDALYRQAKGFIYPRRNTTLLAITSLKSSAKIYS